MLKFGRFVVGGLTLAVLVVAGSFLIADEKEKIPTKKVMQVCMKGGLCKKAIDGKADEEEKKKLLAMFEALPANKPPKGEEASWKEKCAALIEAAKEVVAGKEGAGAKLQKAANCMACHSVHR